MAAKKIEIIYDIDGKAIDVALEKSLNLQQSVKALTSELRRTKEGTAEFSVLTNKLNDTRDNLDRVNAKSKEFFGTLSLLPGPVGQFSNQIDNTIGLLKTFSGFSLKDIGNQLKGLIGDIGGIISALGKATGITKIYTILNDALAASFVAVGVGEEAAAVGARVFAAALTTTGIGALVVALGYLIGKLMEVGQEADLTAGNVAKLNAEFNKLAVDSKLNGEEVIAQMKAQGKTDAEVYAAKKKLKQEDLDNARAAFKQYQGQMQAAEILDQKGGEGYKKALEGRKEAEKNIKQYKHDLRMIDYSEEERLLKEDEARKKNAHDKEIANSKQAQEKIIQDTKTYYDKLRTVEQENEILKSKSSYERAYLKIVQDAKNEEEEIKKLKLKDEKINGIVVTAEQKRVKLINQIRTNANYKIEQLEYDTNKKLTEDKIKEADATIELQNIVIEKRTAMIKDEYERQKQTLENAALDEKHKVNLSIASAERKAQAIKAIEDKLAFDINQLKEDTAKKENQKNIEKIDNELKFLQIRNESIRKGTIEFFDSQRDILDKSQQRELMALDLTEQQKTDIKSKYAALRKDIDKQEFDAYVGYVSAGLSTISNFYTQEQQINSLAMNNELDEVKGNAEAQDKIKEKYFYKNRDAQVGQAIISTLQSAISAYSSLAVIPVVGPALGAIAAAAALAFGYKQVSLIKAQKYQSSLSTGTSGEAAPPAAANYGKNYGDGGMIEGPRHAGGGVMINAEGGEAVMTRGAVTMFAPLLSAMNQMGGGTSFSKGAVGQANNDHPKTTNILTQSQIVKTYVVSSELTTEAQKQARLKDLSTL